MKLRNLIYLLLVLCLLNGCASTYGDKANIPIYNGANAFPNNGKGIVKMKMVYEGFVPSKSIFVKGETKKQTVLTQWRKLNADKTEGKLMLLTGSRNFIDGIMNKVPDEKEEIWMLESGNYVLTHIETFSPKYVQQSKFAWWNGIGWDKTKNQPIYASFTVKAGETITLPTIYLSVNYQDPKNLKFELDVDSDPHGLWTFGDILTVRKK